MTNYVTINHPVFGEFELREDLANSLTPAELNRMLLAEDAQYIEENDIDLDAFSSHFVRELTSTTRGVQELATGERTTDATSDYLAELALASDPVWGYSGMVAGAILDPVTLPLVFTKLLKLGKIADMAVGGMAGGAFGGALGPVREEYGEDRLTHVAYGAAFGGALGTGLGVLMRKYGVESPEELQKLYNEADAATKAEMEQAAQDVGKSPDFQAAAQKAESEAEATVSSRMDADEDLLPADAEVQATVRKQVNEQLDAEKAEADAKVQAEAQVMREEAATIPSRGERQEVDKSVRTVEQQLDYIKRQIDDMNRAKKATKKDKTTTGKVNRRRVKAIDERIKALEIHKADTEASLEPLRQRQRDYQVLEQTRKDVEHFDTTGEMPQRLKDLAFNDPRLPAKETTAPVTPARPDLPAGAVDPLTQGGRGPFAVSPTAQGVQAANVTPRVQPTPQAPTPPPAPRSPVPDATPQPTRMLPEQPPVERMERLPQKSGIAQAIDRGLGTLSTRLRERFPAVFHALRKFEATVQEVTQRRLRESKPFFDALDDLPPNLRGAINMALSNGRFDIVEKLAPKHMLEQLKVIRKELADIHAELKAQGIDIDYRDNYFPRRVKDLRGLRAALGREHEGKITQAINEFKKKNNLTEITPDQEAEIINKVVQNIYRPKTARVGSTGKRTVMHELPADLLKFYEEPSSALAHYYRNMTELSAKHEFFGKSAVKNTDGSVRAGESIGNVIADARLLYNMSAEEEAELISMLQARFVEGEKSMGLMFSTIRDLGYAGTIGNIISAITNLGDLGTSMALHGFKNTVASLFGKMSGNKYNMIDMGIDHTIAHELQDNRTTAQLLHKIFKGSGFAAIDRLGKNTVVNAAMRKNEALAKSEKGKAKLREKWGKVFGDETEALINDLELGNVTANTKLLAFHELSDVQPISLSEMPEWYLRKPEGRLLYMLKSFTLKQYDIVRRNIVQEYAKGNKAQAIKNATAFVGYVTAANVGTQVVKDWMQGREVRPEDIPTRSMWTLLGVFGMNQYVAGRYLSQGDLGGAISSTLLPPTPLLETAKKGVAEAKKMVGDEEYNYAKASRALPIVGPLVYSWFGGGRENFNERLDED